MGGLGGVGGGLVPGDADDAFAVGLEEGLAFGVLRPGLRGVVPLGAVGFDDEVVLGAGGAVLLGARRRGFVRCIDCARRTPFRAVPS